MQPRIVVPLDGSAFGKRALPLALALARRSGASIELVHVHEPPMVASGAPPFDARFDDEERARMRTELLALAKQLVMETGLAVTARFLNGEVVPSLRQYIASSDASLVVMMTHGRGGLSRIWLGSVADGLIRVSPAPVLLVRGGSEWPSELREPIFRRVLVPLDGSDMAVEILPHVLSLATPNETTLVLFSVIDPRLALQPTAVDVRFESQRIETLVESVRRVTEERLTRLADELRVNRVDVSLDVVVDAQPAQRILTDAEERQIDLIALATHSRRALGRFLIGGTADKVIRGAHVPVLV
ncbi:MAG: universal stress protein, partial [Gemmatimonadota bacterium]